MRDFSLKRSCITTIHLKCLVLISITNETSIFTLHYIFKQIFFICKELLHLEKLERFI